MKLIEIDNVTKRYGATEVLSGLSLDVDAHQVVCLIGPSGCGKSTLLRCINQLESIDGGRITLHGDRIDGRGVNLDMLRREVGIVFQGYNLFPHMSVIDNVTLGPIQVLGMAPYDAREAGMSLLARIGLAHKAQAFPDRLSGGQQQRVAIVRALMMDPTVLLLDEITSALDPELVSEVLDIVRDLAAKGMTMVLATHEMGFAREVADKVCFLQGGVVYESGPPRQIFDAPEGEKTRVFLRSIVKAGRL
ncbi:amino acid ABC transporter ATP-binding protein (PAAT family) [Paraburkholderia unamae]|uniref:Amino acid ABC transporter ATP-binding protein (PAAT family) n=1 Tax=Paraburkholderia unamae TaxID=219649 RepID=A0ABX5KIV2_9BURK|nr:amino acid ABC transporter ATP-binding protein (PAAT family) [Paraburkholderia unamae]